MSVECTLVEAGYSRHAEAVVLRGGRWRVVRLPALVGVLRHPSAGVVLFDTGYAPRVRAAAEGWPQALYPHVVPFWSDDGSTARAALGRLGIAADDVRTIVVSHFHPDHVGGLRDFPRARIVSSARAWNRVVSKRGWAALQLGFLPRLLPPDFAERVQLVSAFEDPGYGAFPASHDLFGDGQLRLIPLPGHAAGQIGLLAEVSTGRRVFFVADACWVSAGFERGVEPSYLTRLVTDDGCELAQTLARIHSTWQADPGLLVVPSHCPRFSGGRPCA